MDTSVPPQLLHLGHLLASPPLLSVPPHLLSLPSQPEDLAVEPQVPPWHCSNPPLSSMRGVVVVVQSSASGAWDQGSHLFLSFHRPNRPLQPQ